MKNALELAKTIANELSQIEGIVAVVLGGSFSRGEALPGSDIDLGLYYDPEKKPSVKALRELAAKLDNSHDSQLITDFGEWGPWINGGGWLKINGQAVDWLFRDIRTVSKVINDCCSGQTACHYTPGHPHGFHDHYYLAETYYCQPLYDSDSTIAKHKEKIKEYPSLLKKTLIQKYLWEAEFSIQTGEKAIIRQDLFYINGSIFRAVACLVQVFFALNERYLMNEKGALSVIETFQYHPKDFKKRVENLFIEGKQKNELSKKLNELKLLIEETKTWIPE